ncbi:MAG TPA: hypothetical protein DIC36_04360 [Gammaproteobacteria bacterium]|nr:hypothetical protein [Gammaproteobacteria bacterium]
MAREDREKTDWFGDQATPAAALDGAATPGPAPSAGTLREAVYWLTRDKLLAIGRAPDNDLCLPDQVVSKHHARVGVTAEGSIVVEDLGSSNGTYVNGERITRHTLGDGDTVLIPPYYALKFRYRVTQVPEKTNNNKTDPDRDALTGLYAKQYLLLRMEEGFFLAKKRNEELALLMLDVDHFEKIVETHGPAAGDVVLREVARVVGSVLGREDVFARYENHTFGALLRDRNEATAAVLAQRIRRTVKNHSFLHDGKEIDITVSLGVGFLTRNTKSPMDFLSAVLSNLAKARRAGTDTINGSQSLRGIVQPVSNKDVA